MEQVSEDLDSYEEIFAELYEKYKVVSSEISLLRVGFSAAVLNFSNKAHCHPCFQRCYQTKS